MSAQLGQIAQPGRFAQLRRWRPDLLAAVADTVEARRAGLDAMGARWQQAGDLGGGDLGAGGIGSAGWAGAAAAVASTRHTEADAERRHLAESLSAAARALRRAADEAVVVARLAEHVTQVSDQHGLAVTDDARVVLVPGWHLPADPAVAQTVSLVREGAAEQVRGLVDALLAHAAQVDCDLASALGASALRGTVGIGALADPAMSVPRADLPPGLGGPGWTAHDTAAWWSLLTPSDRERLVAEHPDAIGGADGLPAAVRDRANRARLDQAERDVMAERDRLHAPWSPFLPLPIADERWLAASRRVLDQLASLRALRAVLAQADGRTRQLLCLDLSGRLTRAAVSVGDVDRAGHVAVFVGGLSTTVNGDVQRYDARLSELTDLAERQAREHGDGRPVAAVTWMGYEAPQWDDVLDPRRSVLTPSAAMTGAPPLARFLSGLDGADPAGGSPHLSVWAHSYGSTTAGLALSGAQTGVDDLVVLGSPGLGVREVAQLHLAPGHLHVLENADDVIADLGVFGADPDHLRGADVLSTSSATLPGGGTGARSAGHSGYLSPGSTSAWNLAAVAAGTPQLLVRDVVSRTPRSA